MAEVCTGEAGPGKLLCGVLDPYQGDVPYSNFQLPGSPLVLTVPLNVAAEPEIADTDVLHTSGKAARADAGQNSASAPTARERRTTARMRWASYRGERRTSRSSV
jgi:hypothetical protein